MNRSGDALAKGKPQFDFARATLIDEPFPHFSTPDFINAELAEEILRWFEGDAPWMEHNIREFYELYDLNFRDCWLPPSLQFLTTPKFCRELIRSTELVFGKTFLDRVDVTAHKLVPPYRIRTHTDFGEKQQTHRLLIQLNRGWSADCGGVLMLLSRSGSDEVAEGDKFYIPYFRRGICFEISPRSFHAVSPVNRGTRYTFCMSFYESLGTSAGRAT